ncbi:MAG: site-specific integrase [Bacteroidaceae bacterium]|nr:site-specific integrase [Bacteroidaceae bacterium]
MVTVKIKFRPSTVKGRPGTIIYLVTCRRIVRQITTKYKVFPEEWDARQSKVMPVDAERVDAVRQIVRKMERDMKLLRSAIVELRCSGRRFTSDDVVGRFRETLVGHSFFCFMDDVIGQLSRLNKLRTAETYTSTLSSFRRFRNGEDIIMDEITPDLMQEYEAFLKANGMTRNTISFYNRILRAVYNRAVEKGLSEQRNPFRHVYTGIDRTVKRAIPLKVIRRLRGLDLSQKPNWDLARDMFLFSFYTRGMSFIDMAYLRKTDLCNGILSYRRRKTGQRMFIRWEKCMQEIIDKYPNSRTEYLLPILRGTENERTQYRSTQRLINNKLKQIASAAGLPVNLTMYVSRHSWASIARSQHIPVSVISEGMGHDSENTTQIYLASLDNSIIDKANRMILKKL